MFRSALLLGLSVALGAPASTAACPTNELVIPNATPVLTDAPVSDLVDIRDGVVYYRAAYDLVNGWVGMVHSGSLAPTSALARDTFTLTGVAPGTPVPVRVQWVVDGSISTDGCGGSGCWGNAEAEIRSGDLSAEKIASFNLYAAEVRPFQLVVELPLTLIAGTATDIEFRLEGWRPPGASHKSEGAGPYRFLDLPAEAGVVSCNGFVGLPSPAMPASWGSVKAAYR